MARKRTSNVTEPSDNNPSPLVKKTKILGANKSINQKTASKQDPHKDEESYSTFGRRRKQVSYNNRYSDDDEDELDESEESDYDSQVSTENDTSNGINGGMSPEVSNFIGDVHSTENTSDSIIHEEDTAPVNPRRSVRKSPHKIDHRVPSPKNTIGSAPFKKPSLPTAKSLNSKDSTNLHSILLSNTSARNVLIAWTRSLQSNASLALFQLIELLVRASGFQGSMIFNASTFSQHCYHHEDSALHLERLQKLDPALYASKLDIPLNLSSKSKNRVQYRKRFTEFFEVLVSELSTSLWQATNDKNNSFLATSLVYWLIAMSSCHYRPFRVTASLAGLTILKSLCHNLVDTESEEDKKKKPIRKNSNGSDVDDSSTTTSTIQLLFNGIFVHRYRDTDPYLRVLSIQILPDCILGAPRLFLDNSYLRYLGWTLSDKHPDVRECSLQGICRILCGGKNEQEDGDILLDTLVAAHFSKIFHSEGISSEENLPGRRKIATIANPASLLAINNTAILAACRQFMERFTSRFIEMAGLDISLNVQCRALTVITVGILFGLIDCEVDHLSDLFIPFFENNAIKDILTHEKVVIPGKPSKRQLLLIQLLTVRLADLRQQNQPQMLEDNLPVSTVLSDNSLFATLVAWMNLDFPYSDTRVNEREVDIQVNALNSDDATRSFCLFANFKRFFQFGISSESILGIYLRDHLSEAIDWGEMKIDDILAESESEEIDNSRLGSTLALLAALMTVQRFDLTEGKSDIRKIVNNHNHVPGSKYNNQRHTLSIRILTLIQGLLGRKFINVANKYTVLYMTVSLFESSLLPLFRPQTMLITSNNHTNGESNDVDNSQHYHSDYLQGIQLSADTIKSSLDVVVYFLNILSSSRNNLVESTLSPTEQQIILISETVTQHLLQKLLKNESENINPLNDSSYKNSNMNTSTNSLHFEVKRRVQGHLQYSLEQLTELLTAKLSIGGNKKQKGNNRNPVSKYYQMQDPMSDYSDYHAHLSALDISLTLLNESSSTLYQKNSQDRPQSVTRLKPDIYLDVKVLQRMASCLSLINFELKREGHEQQGTISLTSLAKTFPAFAHLLQQIHIILVRLFSTTNLSDFSNDEQDPIEFQSTVISPLASILLQGAFALVSEANSRSFASFHAYPSDHGSASHLRSYEKRVPSSTENSSLFALQRETQFIALDLDISLLCKLAGKKLDLLSSLDLNSSVSTQPVKLKDNNSGNVCSSTGADNSLLHLRMQLADRLDIACQAAESFLSACPLFSNDPLLSESARFSLANSICSSSALEGSSNSHAEIWFSKKAFTDNMYLAGISDELTQLLSVLGRVLSIRCMIFGGLQQSKNGGVGGIVSPTKHTGFFERDNPMTSLLLLSMERVILFATKHLALFHFYFLSQDLLFSSLYNSQTILAEKDKNFAFSVSSFSHIQSLKETLAKSLQTLYHHSNASKLGTWYFSYYLNLCFLSIDELNLTADPSALRRINKESSSETEPIENRTITSTKFKEIEKERGHPMIKVHLAILRGVTEILFNRIQKSVPGQTNGVDDLGLLLFAILEAKNQVYSTKSPLDLIPLIDFYSLLREVWLPGITSTATNSISDSSAKQSNTGLRIKKRVLVALQAENTWAATVSNQVTLFIPSLETNDDFASKVLSDLSKELLLWSQFLEKTFGKALVNLPSTKIDNEIIARASSPPVPASNIASMRDSQDFSARASEDLLNDVSASLPPPFTQGSLLLPFKPNVSFIARNEQDYISPKKIPLSSSEDNNSHFKGGPSTITTARSAFTADISGNGDEDAAEFAGIPSDPSNHRVPGRTASSKNNSKYNLPQKSSSTATNNSTLHSRQSKRFAGREDEGQNVEEFATKDELISCRYKSERNISRLPGGYSHLENIENRNIKNHANMQSSTHESPSDPISSDIILPQTPIL